MIRRSVAGMILGVSLLIGSFAWTGFLALRTVFDPNRSREVAQELLDNEEVRAQLSENLAFAVGSVIPAEIPVSDQVIDDVASEILNDPAVEALILDAFADSHAAFLGQGDAPESIDLTAVAAVARSSLVAASPQLDAVIPRSPQLSVPLPTERIPNVAPVRGFLEKAVPVLAVLAIGGAAVALFATSDRPSILRRAGFWALTTTAFFLAVGLGIPWLLREYAPDQAEVLAALMSALLRSTLVPSAALGLVGVGLLTTSALWPSNGSSRPSRARPRSVPGPGAAPQYQPQTPATGAVPQVRRPAPATGPTPQIRRHVPGPAQQLRRQASAPVQPRPAAQAAPTPQPRAAPATQGTAAAPPSPYPDAAAPPATPTHPESAQSAPATPNPDSRPQQSPVPGPAASHSVFSDVPSPTDSGFVPEPRRSVFPEPESPQQAPVPAPPDTPTAEPTDPYAAFTPRWVEGHGWLLHPDDPRPTPAEAVWVEGLGHVILRSR